MKNITDDIIVFGSTRDEHDANLDRCLHRLALKGLRLNQSKCDFLSNTLSFFGQIFLEEGTRPDPKRVDDPLNAPQPSNAHEVRRLGMANYSSKYIRDFATLTASLRDLTKKEVRFEWTQKHQTVFEKLKKTLATAPCMSYFDKNKETFVIVDASPVGFSAILSQKPQNSDNNNHQIIAYASRALMNDDDVLHLFRAFFICICSNALYIKYYVITYFILTYPSKPTTFGRALAYSFQMRKSKSPDEESNPRLRGERRSC